MLNAIRSRSSFVGALVAVLSLGLLAPAVATPSVPDFGPGIDAYARYDGQKACIQTEQPGVADFRALVMSAYPRTGRGNIVRSCSVGGVSEHKEGRAWDWMVNASNATERKQADELLAWLLATDRHGNRHALARRFGIMYIIWNGRVWSAYRPNDGWAPYTGANPHTDHVHFSFSWDGALRKTTYWTSPLLPPSSPPPQPAVPEIEWVSASLTDAQRDDVVGFDPSTGRWQVGISDGSRFRVENWGTYSTRTGWQSHLVGDFNANGRDDVLSYHPGTGNWWLGASTGSTFQASPWAKFSSRTGWTHHLSGDFTGSGHDSVASYHAASGRFWVTSASGGSVSSRLFATLPNGPIWTHHVVGDFNGDRTADIASYAESTGEWRVNLSTGQSFQSSVWGRFGTRTGWTHHLVGDFAGAGSDQIASYHPSNGAWWISRPTGNSSFSTERWATFTTRTGWQDHVVGDVDGDEMDDIISYHPSAGSMWVSRSIGDRFQGSRWASFSTRTGWGIHLAGDFTGNQRSDLTSFHPSNKSWWTSESQDTSFTTRRWALGGY